MLDSGVLIWRTQPYSSSIRIICISQLISMSTPGIWFEARGGRQRSTALEAGSDISAPQSSPQQERSQPSRGKWGSVGSRLEDPAAQRCPEGPLNLQAQQAPSYRKSLFRLRAPEPRTIMEERGGCTRQVPGRAGSSSHRFSSHPTQTKRPHNLPGFHSATPSHSLFPTKYGIPRVLPQLKIWPSAGCWVYQKHTPPLRTSTKTIRRNDLHFSFH